MKVTLNSNFKEQRENTENRKIKKTSFLQEQVELQLKIDPY